jgi:hypothetical protein
MTNAFDDVRAAVAQAREQLHAADKVAYNMADLLRGRLRKVEDAYVLRALKRERQGFNAVTGKWDTRQKP